jgi:hypothetical protein
VFGRSGASAPPAVRKFSRHGHPGHPCAGTSGDSGDRVHLSVAYATDAMLIVLVAAWRELDAPIPLEVVDAPLAAWSSAACPTP